MPSINSLDEMPRRELHVFYVLDTSKSMEGAKINALNHAMEESMETLKTFAKNSDIKLKIAVMEFNTGCRWITSNGPEDLEEGFKYEYLEAGGLSDMGAALKELNSKLSRHAFLNSMTGAMMPVIIFMTDGYATDNYEKELGEIRKNRWFARGTKIGFALGDDPDVKMLSSIVGNSEAVIKTTDLELFKRLMKFVSVTASMLVSQSATPETAGGAKEIIDQAKAELDIPEEALVYIGEDQYNKEPDPPVDPDNGTDGWDDEEW